MLRSFWCSSASVTLLPPRSKICIAEENICLDVPLLLALTASPYQSSFLGHAQPGCVAPSHAEGQRSYLQSLSPIIGFPLCLQELDCNSADRPSSICFCVMPFSGCTVETWIHHCAIPQPTRSDWSSAKIPVHVPVSEPILRLETAKLRGGTVFSRRTRTFSRNPARPSFRLRPPLPRERPRLDDMVLSFCSPFKPASYLIEMSMTTSLKGTRFPVALVKVRMCLLLALFSSHDEDRCA